MSPAATTINFRNKRIWISGLVMMPLILLLDVPYSGHPNIAGQMLGSAVGWVYLGWVYTQVSRRFQKFIVIGLAWGLIGEVMLALWFGMYDYRFKNIPFYVPPGHVGAMVVSYFFCREPWTIRNRRPITAVLLTLMTCFVAYWYTHYNDQYGALLFFPFLAVLALAKESRTFFLVIFAVTTYMELIGTRLGCWAWHPILMNKYENWPGASPPSGIVFLYLFFDVAVLGTYLSTHLKIRARYDGRKAWRRRQRKLAAESDTPFPFDTALGAEG